MSLDSSEVVGIWLSVNAFAIVDKLAFRKTFLLSILRRSHPSLLFACIKVWLVFDGAKTCRVCEISHVVFL